MRRLLSRWRRERAAAARWLAGLAWFRLRYAEPAGLARCLRLLSRPAACGRVALVYRPDAAVSRLYVGLPAAQASLLARMAGDFGFSARPAEGAPLAEGDLAALAPLVPAEALPWERPFLAQVVGESVFVASGSGSDKTGMGRVGGGNIWRRRAERGAYLPAVPAGAVATDWGLPTPPPPGLALAPYRNGHVPPAALVGRAPAAAAAPGEAPSLANAHASGDAAAPSGWPLGWTAAGTPLRTRRALNIYGQGGAVAAWLVALVPRCLGEDPAGLVVIDGAGDLVPRLKRRAAVTRLLGERLTYLDLDSAALTAGFNPLAPVPGETETALVGRWEAWFAGMGVHPQGVALLARVRRAGVADIPGLRHWLKQAARQEPPGATTSLELALNRLLTSRRLREWLEWPAQRGEGLPAGALFFACQATGWARRQLLHGVLLAALARPATRLIVHSFPWRAFPGHVGRWPTRTVLSNGPLLSESVTLLVASSPSQEAILARRFLGNDARLAENLALLRPGEGLVLVDGMAVYTTWRRGDSGRRGGDENGDCTLPETVGHV